MDLMIITEGLEKRTSNYALDVEHEWSPAQADKKGGVNGEEVVYLRGKPTDHKAQKVTLMLDLVERGQAGNRAIINYNNRDGWKLYYKVSNEFAPKIMKTAVKELSDTVKEHKKIDYNIQEKMKAEKALAMKVKIVDKVLMGPKH